MMSGVIFVAGLSALAAPESTGKPEELGDVSWSRDLDGALRRSAASGKPVFVLFDEVPGCATVRRFGAQVLSHPLIVDAIEAEFEPVVVYNNVGGADGAVLESFGEPSWNNPVVRIIDAERRPLATRFAGDYSVGGLARNMQAALRKVGRSVPPYLATLVPASLDEAIFSMHCFWSGEVAIGAVDGVRSTEAGFMGGREVVRLRFDPKVVGFAELLSSSHASGAADGVFTADSSQAAVARRLGVNVQAVGSWRSSTKDDKYQLAHTPLRFVPMSPAQATKVNAALGTKRDPLEYLSPKQRARLDEVRDHPERAGAPRAPTDDLVAAFAGR